MSFTSPVVPPAAPRASWGASPALKVILIVFLIVCFLVPLFLVYEVVAERESRYNQVVAEIGRLWGGPQRIAGPILVVPYREPPVAVPSGAAPVEPPLRWAYALPDQYRVDATADPEKRRRGIFESVVYTVRLAIAGDFVVPDIAALAGQGATIDWDGAFVYVGVGDARSIREGVSLLWGGRELPFQPGAPGEIGQQLGAGMTARVPGLAPSASGEPIAFSTELTLNGSERLDFLPLGRDNRMTVASPWPDPSFDGYFLPVSSRIGADGFEAAWELSYFGRGYPQSWTSADGYLYSLWNSAFGVRFFQPVDSYHETERSAKYGILFIIFTFTVFFLFETVGRMRIHIFQYGLVGLSQVIFYLLLLSFAERMGFDLAYALGAAAVIVQIALYCRPVLGSWRRCLVLAALLAILYAALYALMQLEDLALLLGSLGLFAALSAVMYATRKIDWYALGPARPTEGRPGEPEPEPAAP